MSSKEKMQLKLTFVFNFVLLLFLLGASIVARFLIFSGVDEKDIDISSTTTRVTYSVSSIKTHALSNGTQNYVVSFVNEDMGAPAFESELNVMPQDMELGMTYSAEWLNVQAKYAKYSRSKDLVAMDYTGVILDEAQEVRVKEQVKDALLTALEDYTSPNFKWFQLAVLGLGIVLCTLISRLTENLSSMLDSPSVWDDLQNQLIAERDKAIDLEQGYGIGLDALDISEFAEPEADLPFRYWGTDDDYKVYQSRKKLGASKMTDVHSEIVLPSSTSIRRRNVSTTIAMPTSNSSSVSKLPSSSSIRR